MEKRRVVVTGLGIVCPFGWDTEAVWKSIIEGKSGIDYNTRFDTEKIKTKLAGEVKEFNPEDFMEKKVVKNMDRVIHFAITAARIAMDDARLKITASLQERTAVSISLATAGNAAFEKNAILAHLGKANEISPHFVASYIPDMSAAQIAIRFRAEGPCLCPIAACAGGTVAIGEAFRLIQWGYADRVIAGGSEAPLILPIIASLENAGATSKCSDPMQACRPFDGKRDGFIPAEGTGILILEELSFALEREAKIYGEIVGFGQSCDAYHITSPSPAGKGAALCMRNVLKDAQILPEQIDYINAHGTSTVLNDKTETEAIKTVFGNRAYKIPTNSNKSQLGHSFAASGAQEAIFTLLAMRNGIIPPTIHLVTPDPECDLDYVPNQARKAEINIALSNSFGFGGKNASIILKRFIP